MFINNHTRYLPLLFSAAVSSILRLWAFVTRDYKSPDLTYTTANSAIWSCVEGSIAIISACLPSLKPLLIAVRSTYRKLRTRTSPSSLDFPSSGSYSLRRMGFFLGDHQPKLLPNIHSETGSTKQGSSSYRRWRGWLTRSEASPPASTVRTGYWDVMSLFRIGHSERIAESKDQSEGQV